MSQFSCSFAVHCTSACDISTRYPDHKRPRPRWLADRWFCMRQQILSLFVTDYSKTELLALIPGLSKWRIDEARKHAFQTKPGQPIDPPRITRCRLDAVKVDHFLDLLSSPSFLQDVAYGTRTLKLENGQSLEFPNLVRTVISSHLVRMYLNFCEESNFEPLRRSTLFNIIKVWIINASERQILIRVNCSRGVAVVVCV